MTNKMTNNYALEIALEVLRNTNTENQYTEVIEKLEKMKAQNAKKSGGARKPTATQIENEKLKTAVLEYLVASGKALTVSEMMKEIPEVAELTNQRVTSLVTSLFKDGKVVRFVEKRKAYFEAVKD